MIIFGTKGITTTPEKGNFHCPSCSSSQDYGLKRVRRFFTLYFIPIIPLDKLGEYIECATCKDTYKPTILDYSPDTNSQAVEAEYFYAIKKVMLHVLLADGVVEDSEIETVIDIYQKITNSTITKDELVDEIDQIQRYKEEFSNVLINLQGSLNDEGKEIVIKAALMVALADGEFQEDEQIMLARVGQDLGMTKAHVSGVINSV